MKTFLIFALLLLQRSLSMESNSSDTTFLNDYDTFTENSTNNNEFLEQLEKAKEDSKNEEFQKDDFEEWEEYNEYDDYMNNNDVKDGKRELNEPNGFQSNEFQHEIQEEQKPQERDELEKEANFKLATRERFPNVEDEWIEKGFFWYGDCFKREHFFRALEKYNMSREDVYYAFKKFGDEHACQYLDEVTEDKNLTLQIWMICKKWYDDPERMFFIKDLLGKFGFQFKLQTSALYHAKYFNFREHWVKKASECETQYKRYLRDVVKLQDLFGAQGKHMKGLIGSFLDMNSKFNLALTSKAMLENSGLLGKHICVCMNSRWDTLNLNVEFDSKDFKMIRFCIKEQYHDSINVANFSYTHVSIVMILPDENDAWIQYTFEGEIMIPEKGINIDILNKETYNIDISDLEKLKKSALKKVIWKQENFNGKTDQKANIRIICKPFFYHKNFILKLHIQK